MAGFTNRTSNKEVTHMIRTIERLDAAHAAELRINPSDCRFVEEAGTG